MIAPYSTRFFFKEVRKWEKEKEGSIKRADRATEEFGGVSLIKIGFECALSSGNTEAHRGRIANQINKLVMQPKKVNVLCVPPVPLSNSFLRHTHIEDTKIAKGPIWRFDLRPIDVFITA